MKNRCFFLTILSLSCVFMLNMESRAEVRLEFIEGLDQTTWITDTEDVTFTMRIFSEAGDNRTLTFYIGGTQFSEEFAKSVSVDPSSITVDGEGAWDVIFTIKRTLLSKVGPQEFRMAVTNLNPAPPGVSIPFIPAVFTLIVNVEQPGVEVIDISLSVIGDANRITTNADSNDIVYSLRITNHSGYQDLSVNLTLADIGNYGNVDPTQVYFSDASVILAVGASSEVTLTIPRDLMDRQDFILATVLATPEGGIPITTTISVDVRIVPGDLPIHRVVISEFMFESEGGNNILPQWIELHNRGDSKINLRDYKLEWRRMQPSFLEVTTIFSEDFIIPAQQCRLIVTAFGRHSDGDNLQNDAVYPLSVLHAAELRQDDIANRNELITRGGFSIKLINPLDVLVDHIGTLNGGNQTWELPVCLIDGVRSSLIRRFDKGVPRKGTEKTAWLLAFDVKRLVKGIYYGSPSDLGTPGYRRGKPLPVELSQFSASLFKDEGGVIINWTTESELNNAGFNIFRSTSTNNFQRINPKLIEGAGTTGQRSTYQFIDKTAKPDVAYYYRLEDVDLSGTRGILTTYRLGSVISPTGKRITVWGSLKGQRSER